MFTKYIYLLHTHIYIFFMACPLKSLPSTKIYIYIYTHGCGILLTTPTHPRPVPKLRIPPCLWFHWDKRYFNF